jgi:tRNA threonylcarbamoyladenosine biosynthesis protein TsaB
MPKGVALAAFASGKLIDARDLKASYCAVSQAERLKKND